MFGKKFVDEKGISLDARIAADRWYRKELMPKEAPRGTNWTQPQQKVEVQNQEGLNFNPLKKWRIKMK